jgi:hypothetical protein
MGIGCETLVQAGEYAGGFAMNLVHPCKILSETFDGGLGSAWGLAKRALKMVW